MSLCRLPILLALFCLLLVAFAERGFAEAGYLPAPFVPWLKAQGYQLKETDLEQPRPGAAQKPWERPPEKPALTPRDTLALMRALGEKPEDIDIPSPLEQSYSSRVDEPLHQFGYDLFGKPGKNQTAAENRTGLPAGTAQEDFILSSGDRLSIIFRGQRNSQNIYRIDDQGKLVVEDLAPVTAAGRSLGDVRKELRDEAATLHNTDVFVSLDAVRQIDVLVAGHVVKPGRKTLTVFDSVLDALDKSGGIEKTGSLRRIKLIRRGHSTIIDLYGLLVNGSADMDLALRDGDKLIVPPIGPTVAIAGGVKRPGIYEIAPRSKSGFFRPDQTSRKLSLGEMLGLAGGVLAPGQNRFIRLGLTGDGRETVREVSKSDDPAFGDGSILSVAPSLETRTGTVELTGDTNRPGLHDLAKAPTLSALLSGKTVFGPDIYPLIGVIERWDQDQMAARLIGFPPLLVAKGKFDRKLQDGDVVHLFSRTQILELQKQDKDKDKSKKPEKIEPAAGTDEAAPENPGHITDPALVSFLTERSAFIRGAVRDAGAYPVAEGTTLKNLVAVSGGLALEASTGDIEVTSALNGKDGQALGRSGTTRIIVDFSKDDPAAIMLEPGDTVRVNQKFLKVADNSVLIIGQVAHPGRYDLMPGDKMSDLLRRAGGLTPQAYPDGAIFSRESERKAQEARFRAEARDLEQALAAAMEDKEHAPDATELSLARDLAAELRNVRAVGRITVEADPGTLATDPEQDILLQSGDRIFIPQRPLTVRVNGEVLSPASLQFRKDKDPAEYIAEAGGFTYNADKDRAFVLYPDGSAQPLHVNAWNHQATFIPPGSTIVVPRDPKPFDFLQSARDFTQILSNLAITGIFIDDLKSN